MNNGSASSWFQLKVGLVVMVFLTVAIGGAAFYQVWHLSGLTEKLYLHPFAVTSALRDIRSETIDIDSILADQEMETSLSDVKNKQSEIEEKEGIIQEYFFVVEERYLGSKDDLHLAKDTFRQWCSLIDQAFYARVKNFDREMQSKTFAEARSRGEQFLSNLQVMIDFAGSKAKKFNEQAVSFRESSLYFMLVLVLSSSLVILWIGKFVFKGVVERKQIEETLRESEQRYDLAMNASKDGVFDWNLITNTIYYSPGCKKMLGYEEDELPNDFSVWENLTEAGDVARSREIQQEIVAGKRDSFEMEFKMKHKDGHWVDILSRARSILDENRQPVRIVGTHVDITERKRTEEFLVQSEKMMSLGGLAAGMAHEINNPLAGIMGNAQTIENRVFGDIEKNIQAAHDCGLHLDTIQEYMKLRGVHVMLTAIRESGRRASAIVSNMLNFSRKSGRDFKSTDLIKLLDSTLDLAASDYDLKKKYDFRAIEVIREYDPNFLLVNCDNSEIQQVFFNLFRNGAEAMVEKGYQEDKPRFILRVKQQDDMVMVEVEDNGPGMNEKVRKRIFEPFFTTKDVGKGTGLGLSVSYFIVTDQHKGSMGVDSVAGEWTRFTVKLPIKGKDQLKTPPDLDGAAPIA